MDPLWRMEDMPSRPCRDCGHVGRHLELLSYRCALWERDAASAARVTAERAFRRTGPVLSSADHLCRAAGQQVSEQDAVIGSLYRALEEAQERRDKLQQIYDEHRALAEAAGLQHHGMVEVVRAAEAREHEAQAALEEVVARDGVCAEEVGEYADAVDDAGTEWWRGSDDEETLDGERERRYGEWMRAYEDRAARREGERRAGLRDRRCRREERRRADETEELREHRRSRIEAWADSLQTSAPQVQVKQEVKEEEESGGEDQSWETAPAWTPGAEVKREESSPESLATATAAAVPSQVERFADSNWSEPEWEEHHRQSRTGKPSRSAGWRNRTTRRSRRTAPYRT